MNSSINRCAKEKRQELFRRLPVPWPSSIYSWPLRERHLATKPPPHWGSTSPKIWRGEKNMTLHLGPGHILWAFSSKCWLAAFPTHFLNSSLLKKLEFKEAEKVINIWKISTIYRWINSQKQLDCSRQLRFKPEGFIKNSKACLHLARGRVCTPSSWPTFLVMLPGDHNLPQLVHQSSGLQVEHFRAKPCFH